MIDELQVSNIALIREATLVPSAGLTVLTGETGAGKTALLSALKLILGERADSSTVREGEALASVEARLFDGPHDTEGFTVQRSLSAEGRSRVRIDGRIASVRELSERVGVMMDLCGQHEHQRLLDPAHHVAMVDAWAGRSALEALEHYRTCFKASRAAAKEVRRVEEASRAQGSRVEEARFALERIGEVDPKPGEYEELEELLPRSEHAEVLVATANDAHASLAAEGGALDAVNSAVAELSRMATVDRKLGDIAETLSDACISLEDCANELRAYRDGVAFDPRELARMRERYSDLKGLLRQWGPTMDDVLPCVIARKSCFRWLIMAMNRSKWRVKRLARRSTNCLLPPRRLSALAIRRPRASVTRLAARWLAWRWVVPSSSGSRAIFPVLSGRRLVLRVTSCYTAAVPA